MIRRATASDSGAMRRAGEPGAPAMRRAAPLLCPLVLATLLAAASAIAGPAAYVPDEPYVRPVPTAGIRMLSERVEMVSDGNDGDNIHVRSVSLFTTDAPRTVRVGFPVGIRGEDFAMVWNFQVLVNGVAVPASRSIEIDTLETRSGERRHRSPVFLWPVDFTPGEPCRIEVDYDVLWSGDDLGLYSYGANYFLEKNALWEGPAPEVSLCFRLSSALPLPALSARPGGFFYGADSLAWAFPAGSPAENVELSWSPVLFERFKGRFLDPYRHDGGDDFSGCEAVTLFDSEFWSYFPEIMGSLEDPDVYDEIIATLDQARDARDAILARGPRLSEIQQLNADYCAAVIEVLDESPDLDSLIASLTLVRQRFW